MSEQQLPLNDLLSKYFPMPVAKNVPAVGTIRRVAVTPEIRSINEKDRTIDFISSTEAIDRYGDSIKTSGWKLDNYRRNPVFLWSHKSSEPPIGRTLDVHVESTPIAALVQRVQFADAATYPFADQIFRLYQGKFLNSVSVGFIPLEPPTPILDADGRSTGGYEFTSQELLELSAVPLPANPECVSRAIDSGIITKEDVERIFVRPKDEPATAGDYIGIAFSLGKLAHAAERLDAVVREAKQIASPEDLAHVLGIRAHGEIGSVADLERLFRLG
jgi:Caudovirus prohead serine protease